MTSYIIPRSTLDAEGSRDNDVRTTHPASSSFGLPDCETASTAQWKRAHSSARAAAACVSRFAWSAAASARRFCSAAACVETRFCRPCTNSAITPTAPAMIPAHSVESTARTVAVAPPPPSDPPDARALRPDPTKQVYEPELYLARQREAEQGPAHLPWWAGTATPRGHSVSQITGVPRLRRQAVLPLPPAGEATRATSPPVLLTRLTLEEWTSNQDHKRVRPWACVGPRPYRRVGTARQPGRATPTRRASTDLHSPPRQQYR